MQNNKSVTFKSRLTSHQMFFLEALAKRLGLTSKSSAIVVALDYANKHLDALVEEYNKKDKE